MVEKRKTKLNTTLTVSKILAYFIVFIGLRLFLSEALFIMSLIEECPTI